jgi:hypothetical protein
LQKSKSTHPRIDLPVRATSPGGRGDNNTLYRKKALIPFVGEGQTQHLLRRSEGQKNTPPPLLDGEVLFLQYSRFPNLHGNQFDQNIY